MPLSVLDLPDVLPRSSPNAIAAEAQRRNQGGLSARNTQARANEREAERVKDDTTAGELIGATQVQGGIGFLHRGALENDVLSRADPNYRLPEDFQKQMDNAGIAPEQWELFERATSQEHFEMLKQFAFENQEAAQTQAQFGLIANVAAGFTDPVAFALDASTGGLARAARVGRLANAVRSGVTAAATNATMTLGTSVYDPEVDTENVLLSAGAGLVLGGALGARKGDQYVDAAKVRELVKRDITGSQGSLGAARIEGLPDEPIAGLPRRSLSEFEQAHRDRGIDEIQTQPAFKAIRLSMAAKMGGAKSPTVRAVGRWMFRDGVGYNDRTQAVRESAGERAALNRARFETQLHRSYNAAWNAERKAAGISRWDRGSELAWSKQVADALRGVETDSPTVKAAAANIRKVLDDAFDLGVRSGVLPKGSKNANYFPQLQSRQAYQRLFGEMGLSEDQGVDIYKQAILADMRSRADGEALAKFNEIEDSYKGTSQRALDARTRADARKVDFSAHQGRVREAEAAVAAAGDDAKLRGKAAIKLREAQRRLSRADERFKAASGKLKEAIDAEERTKFALKQAKQLADDGGVDEELAELYARAIIQRGKRQVHGEGSDLVRPLDVDDVEALKETLEEAGASAQKIAAILNRYTPPAQEKAQLGSAKRRIQLDPSYRAKITNRFGQEIEVGVTDFMENDVARVVTAYTRDIAGWSAMASHGNVRNPTELKKLRDLIRREASDAGDNVDDLLRRFDIGANAILGRTTEANPHGTFSRVSRALRDTQFLRVMNQVGFTLFTELGPTVAYAGLRNVMNSVVFIGDFMRRGADGTLKSGEARYLEDLIASGTEHLRNPPFLRLEDDAFMPPIYGDNAFGRGLENLTNQAQRITSVLSGMAPMNTMLQRIAGRATLMKLLQLANDKRPLSAAMLQRLRSWGLDDADREALFASLKGVRKIEDIAEHTMTLEARERMAAFLYRVTRQQVIEGDASDSILLMHSAGGKLLTQFRNFMAYSYERHLLNAAYHWRDWHTWQMVTLFCQHRRPAMGGAHVPQHDRRPGEARRTAHTRQLRQERHRAILVGQHHSRAGRHPHADDGRRSRVRLQSLHGTVQ